MVEISVRHPLSSIIKIATKSSCPEMLSFTYGEKILSKNEQDNAECNSKIDDAASSNASSSKKENHTNEYNIKGKDWFFIPDYAGEAASAVKLQILQIIDLV
jgi:hypothetical protein